MIFQYEYKFNLSNILSLGKFKKLNILDFGCGIGNWKTSDIKSKNIRKITLYDKNKELINCLKSKYKSKKVNINFDYKDISKTGNFNLILFSSVIQYISHKKLKKIINDLSKKKKNLIIIITDVPFLPRFFEFLLLPIFNLKRFLFTLSLIFSKKYSKINYFTYQKKDFYKFKKKFILKYNNNIHDLRFLRYSLIMSLK